MMTYESVQTVRDLVRDAAVLFPNKTFLRYIQNNSVTDETFEEFRKQTDAIASWITVQTSELGHKPKVAMMSANTPLYVKMLLGVMCGGGVSVLIDPQAKPDTLYACLQKVEADILILDPQIMQDAGRIIGHCPGLKQVLFMADGVYPNCGSILQRYAGQREEPQISSSDCAVILFTSGTTGEEKGVMLSNGNLIDSVFNTDHVKGTIKLNVLPMHHAFCLNSDILLSFSRHSTLCMNGDSSHLAENLLLFEPNNLLTVPMVAQALYNKLIMLSQQTGKGVQELKAQVFGSRMERIVTGGAHLPSELVAQYQELGIFLCQGYGMTECSPTIASPDMSRPDKAHTAGRVVKRCQTRVVDGELQVKSPSVMMGYINAPELTEQAITPDGWLRTGDIGYEDEEGFLHITGRKKALIILSNGANVSPEQIENLLLEDQVIQEALVYGEGNAIVAEIYPNSRYAGLTGITDISATVSGIIQTVNTQLPSYKKIMRHIIRTVPFERTASNKIIRNQRASREMVLNPEAKTFRLPEGEMEHRIYNCAAAILGHRDFGVDTDLFTAGLDSLGCITLLGTLSDVFHLTLELDEFMSIPSVEKLTKRMEERSHWDAVDHSIRPVYGMSGVQILFAYVMRGHTTSNIPFLFKLGANVDLIRLREAIRGLFSIHPILNDVVQMFADKGYANFRDDSRPVNVPILDLTEEEWQLRMPTLVRPYLYEQGEPLYHIELYRVGEDKYLFFDVAHIISDGMSMNILLEDMNRLYSGEQPEPETYTYYDFLIDHEHRMKLGLHLPNIAYYCRMMGDKRITRSILNLPRKTDLSSHINAALRGDFRQIEVKDVQAFCHANGVSENVFFLTAFNYLISIYSDSDDTISSSIHNGRIDSRWGRIAGCLFSTYGFRRKFRQNETVSETIRLSAKQILETMRCYLKNPHPDEMFFQYQGELLNYDQIAGEPAQSIPMQLDSLPFHLIVMKTKSGYRYELRFWKNRFHEQMLQLFLDAMDAVLEAMLKNKTMTEVRKSLPGHLFPDENMPRIVDRRGEVQPIGAWGTLADNGKTKIVRLLPDGTVDELAFSGRRVMVENMTGRSFPDLQQIEDVLNRHPDISSSQAFSCYWQDNNIALCADISCGEELERDALKSYMEQNLEVGSVPQQLFKNGKYWN